MKLADLPTGSEAIIISVAGSGAFRKRIIEMGFVKGKLVKSIKNAPLNDPIEYKILDYYVSLRREEANLIEVSSPDSAEAQSASHPKFAAADGGPFAAGSMHSQHMGVFATSDEPKIIRVALVGNPNCGKTTLFNCLSGANEHTGNYSGVTVGATSAQLTFRGYKLEVVDLPGTYSISAYSPEETFVRQKLMEYDPDIVLNVLDVTNLARNLYLTSQLIDMGERMVAALNMYDDFEKSGQRLDYVRLGGMLGVPMVPTVGSKGRGIEALLEKVVAVYEGADAYVRRVRINYGSAVEDAIAEVCNRIDGRAELPCTVPARYMAIKLLENDMDFVWTNLRAQGQSDLVAEVVAVRDRLKDNVPSGDIETYMTDLRYGFIDGALNEALKGKTTQTDSPSQRIDNVLTNRVWGIPIFIAFIWVMFECTFSLGQYPMDWIGSGVDAISGFLSATLPNGPVKDLIVNGIVHGVGGVIVFLPNILILFLFISFMEDTGYMARAAFIMDRMMHKMGLHGKSFIPLIMGFGCNVPAIMATRTIEDRNNRMLTMLVNPFMSCSARLPVYILFCGAFFPERAGTVLFGVYILGILMAVVMCRVFKNFLFKGQELPFVMELPPYRWPSLRGTVVNMWSKASQYLSKMGGVIMVASIIVWFLGYYPRTDKFAADAASQLAMYEAANGGVGEERLSAVADSLQHITAEKEQEYSFIGRIGRFVEPAIAPLGFDWKMGVSLISGVAAKEIVVSSLAVLYRSPGDADDNKQLISSLRSETRAGKPLYTVANAMSFMVFTLLYFPCLATLAAIRSESGHWNDFNTSKKRRRQHKGSWRWALFVAGYTTALAWVMAWLVYNVLSYFGL